MNAKAWRGVWVVVAGLAALAVCAALYVLPASWRPVVAIWLLIGVPLVVFASNIYGNWTRIRAARLEADRVRAQALQVASTSTTYRQGRPGRRSHQDGLQVIRQDDERQYNGRFTIR